MQPLGRFFVSSPVPHPHIDGRACWVRLVSANASSNALTLALEAPSYC